MIMRARTGVQVGDVQKEAHMAYCLGVLNENQEHYDQVNSIGNFIYLGCELFQKILLLC